jgi:hypothetical protein
MEMKNTRRERGGGREAGKRAEAGSPHVSPSLRYLYNIFILVVVIDLRPILV